jgi:phosphatidylglycerophosphate synthase
VTTEAAEYRAEDRAILLGLYQRLLWNRLLPRLPRSLTPNTITVFGEACAVLAPFATWGAVRGRTWLYGVSAALLFTYLTADNLDGQHARRTGQTSALGEFLDHGLDGLASGAVLLCSALAVRIDGVVLVALVGLGSLGFGSVFWAQHRTGVLVTPRISAMEGVTGASLLQLAVLVSGDPAWMHFVPGRVGVASVLLVLLGVCYVYAIVSPALRARRQGARLGELALPVGVVLAAPLYVVAGAHGLAPAILSALVVAAVVCRMIVLRGRGDRGSIASPVLLAPLVPLLLTRLDVAPPEVLAWMGAAVAFVLYARAFVGGVVEIGTRARAR